MALERWGRGLDLYDYQGRETCKDYQYDDKPSLQLVLQDHCLAIYLDLIFQDKKLHISMPRLQSSTQSQMAVVVARLDFYEVVIKDIS